MLDAFLATLLPMRAAKAKLALLKQVRINGGDLMKRHELIERRIAVGAIIGVVGNARVLIDPKTTAFLDQQNATKTGLDYAVFLLAQKEQKQHLEAAQSAAMAHMGIHAKRDDCLVSCLHSDSDAAQ